MYIATKVIMIILYSRFALQKMTAFLHKMVINIKWWVLKTKIRQKINWLNKASRLLLKHVNCIFVFHFQLWWRVCLIYGLTIKSKSDLPHWQSLSLTVGLHEFDERRVSLDFELHYRSILTRHLQVNVLVVFCLHSFLRDAHREVTTAVSTALQILLLQLIRCTYTRFNKRKYF